MTDNNPPTHDFRSPRTAAGAEDYQTGEGLRSLLRRLRRQGPGAWEHDPVAAELMEFAAQKYAELARKHGLDPWEAASAAFDVMRTKAARNADDPWAVITHAVRITCIAEERAQGLLCSVHQARRPHIFAFHDPERFSDRDNPLADYHPALQVAGLDLTDLIDLDLIDGPAEDAENPGDMEDDAAEDEAEEARMVAAAMVEDAARFLIRRGWPPDTARVGVERVCTALTKAGSRQGAFESLRRDRHARALLDVPGRSWSVLLRTLLGNPHPAYATTNLGRGVLLRLSIGETLPMLLRDDDLTLAVSLAAPPRRGRP
ncbi:MAG: hypothetical protein BGO26_10780 [Actinobacteria bacterium 69-20]|nr:hypothetical protein [Actinomycetota bacterium]OJV26343.1 MAG: hypothetical protein BGO26_10780 [Actinobacteria bacterium 69-20]